MDRKLTVLKKIIPDYETLGSISFAWVQGSVVSGYTEKGDYDVILAWDLEELPRGREGVVSHLDERDPENPFVVDHRDINIDRFVMGEQEFNIGHATPSGFRRFHVEPVLSGLPFRDEDILQPVVAVSGFFYGDVLIDRKGEAASIKNTLSNFPPALRKEALRLLRIHRIDLPTLRALGERADWIPYFRDLARIVRNILLAVFASYDVYYPGDKWVLRAFDRFSIERAAVSTWEAIWTRGASPAEQSEAADSLAEWAETRLASRVEGNDE